MEFLAKATDIAKHRTGCAVVCVFEGGTLSANAKKFDQANKNIVQQLIKQKDFSGNAGQTLLLHQADGIAAQRVLLAGFGNASTGQEKDFFNTVRNIALAIKSSGAKDATLYLDGLKIKDRDTQWMATQIVQIFNQVTYSFSQHKSKKPEKTLLTKLTLSESDSKQKKPLQQGLEIGKALAAGVGLAKDLGNQPANVCTPGYLTKEAKRLARNHAKFTARSLNEKQMKSLGMGAFLSVTAGTDEPAQLIIMEYQGAGKSEAPIVLVGKGITFDSGGISIKPSAGMDEMKFDMCGAAAVFGTMQTLAQLQPKINVVALVAAAENLPSGKATKPGDIVESMSGQTIEILNTDAEGRLVLCDTLTYAKKYSPKAVIDVATLTGACVVALGKHATGLYSNQDQLAEDLIAAGKQASDKAWQLPLWDEYQKQLDSNFADMANAAGRDAGSITAACFLSRYTQSFPWAHLDIAGTAWLSGSQKGATGRPVPLLVQYILNQC